jgi:hypothetical protein
MRTHRLGRLLSGTLLVICLSAQAAAPLGLYAQLNPKDMLQWRPGGSSQPNTPSDAGNKSGLPSFLTKVVCAGGGAAVVKATKLYLHGKGVKGESAKQQERQILILAALNGCAIANDVAKSLFLRRSVEGRKLAEQHLQEALSATAPKSMSFADPVTPKLHSTISVDASYVEGTQQCKHSVDKVKMDENPAPPPESLTAKFCRASATDRWVRQNA